MAAATPPLNDPGRMRSGSPIGLGSLARAVKRYSLLVFIFVLLGAAAGALVYFFLPLPRMTGQMVYLVNSNPGGQLTQNYWSDRDPASYRALQANTIVKRELLTAAMREPQVAAQPMFLKDPSIDPVQFLQNNLKIDWSGGTEHMRVKLEGDTQKELEIVLKAINNAFMDRVYRDETERRNKRLRSLQGLKTEQDEQLKTIRLQIRQLLSGASSQGADAEDWTLRQLNAQLSMLDQELLRLNARDRGVEFELKFATDKLKEEEKSVKNMPVKMRPSIVPPQLVKNFVDNDPRVIELHKIVDGLRARMSPYEKTMQQGARIAAYEQLKTELLAKEAELKVAKDGLTIAYEKEIAEQYEKDKAGLISRLTEQRELIRKQTIEVTGQAKQVVEKLSKLKEQFASTDELRAQLTNAETIMNRINNEEVTVKTEMKAPNRVEQWELPYVTMGIEGNRRVKYTALTVIGFLVVGLGLAQWLEVRHRRIQSLDEVSAGLGLQVIGTVPAIPKGGVNARSNWPHLLTEAVNTTRTMLLSGPNSAATKTLLVTSAMSGEGKTSLTTHLAVSLAGAGRRVLLIDADMRRPAVHKVLGVESKPGLAELLVGTARLDDVTITTKVAGLHLVPAGVYSREAAASLSTERWGNLLRDAAVGYDFVLVDSPPILPVADALAIAKNVDGVLISVMQDLSRYGAVQTACQRLSMVGANVLGVVVSGVKTSGGYYYYYYDERYSKAPAPEAAAAGTDNAQTAV